VIKLLSLEDYILAHPMNLHREAFVCFFFEVTIRDKRMMWQIWMWKAIMYFGCMINATDKGLK
jgi:hypothetical protein